jgi:hypothetical protein
MILVSGFENVVHASEAVLAGMTMNPVEPGEGRDSREVRRVSALHLRHVLSCSLRGPVADVTFSGVLREVDTGVEHSLSALRPARLDHDPLDLHHVVSVHTDIRVVAKMSLEGKLDDGTTVKENYVHYWPGRGGEKWNVVRGKAAPTYVRSPPRKAKSFQKPARIVYRLNTPATGFEFRGPGYYLWRVTEAAAAAGIADFQGEYFSSSPWAGSKLTGMPTGYDEILATDLLVLNNTDVECLTDFGQEMVRDFVNAGGAVLFTGGWFAYGATDYEGTPLEELLPVQPAGRPFTLKPMTPPGIVGAAPSARCLRGATWQGRPLCFWAHSLPLKEKAWVELTAGDEPFIVCQTCGKGRVAAILGTCLGNPGPGQTPFWEDGAWPGNLSRLLRWLVFRERKQVR